MQKNDLSYCGDLVRQYDPDRFLISLFAPATVREDLWALFAFNHEIAKTRDVVSETTLGLIRLQWWRDSIKGIYEEDIVPDHEVLKPLVRAIKTHDLPQEQFDKLIYAREFDLEDVLPGNIEGLMNYADFTTQPLLNLAVRITGDDPDVEAVQSVAINAALAGILRSTACYLGRGRVLFPEDLMVKYELTKDNLFEEVKRTELKSMVQDIVKQRVAKAKSNNVILKSSEVLSDIYFRQMASLGYDVLSPQLQREPFLKVLRMFWKIKIL